MENWDTLKARFYVPANDTDGWISRYDIDWGDGTKQRVRPTDGPRCDDGDGHRYPGVQDIETAGAYGNHTYARHGRYRILVTLVSSGCGGNDVQQTSKLTAVSV